MGWLRIAWKIFQLRNSRLWSAAKHAVRAVAVQRELQTATQVERQVSYCPRCGQRPDGDRRMEHAREIALAILGEQPRRSDLDFALAFYYWQSKL